VLAPKQRRLLMALGCVLLSGVVAGCDRSTPSALEPSGPKSDLVATSWWILFAVAAGVCILVTVLAVVPVLLRRRRRQVKGGDGKRFVMICGIILPATVLMATFALSVTDIATDASPPRPAKMTIDVIGHRWWWEVRYQGSAAVTANEIHVPVGMPVQLRLRTADVIHSFWVPEVMPKMDLLPKRVNETWMSVSRPGTYRGQCAEYCGLQHAHMAFLVVAQSRADFDSWLSRQAQDAPAPTTAEARRGMTVLTQSSCATCHTVRGTSANGDVGPDLTHVGGRQQLAAGAIPNDFGHMSGWVANSQTVKPGNIMPPQHLSPDDLRAVVTYLQGLE
jgi:cytochrome c oxidase subunit II